MYIEYVPKRSLYPQGTGGKIECRIQPYMPDYLARGNQLVSLGGVAHSTNLGLSIEHSITTVAINITSEISEKQWTEFFHSVFASETFTFDKDGTEASPVAPVQVYLKQGTFKPKWIGPQHRQFTFTLVEPNAN